jgi:hypothetical protein
VERTHRIVRLEDHDGDGRYDRRTVVRRPDDVPRGPWADGSLYVAAPAEHLELTDTTTTAWPIRARNGSGKTLTAAPTTCTATPASTAGFYWP